MFNCERYSISSMHYVTLCDNYFFESQVNQKYYFGSKQLLKHDTAMGNMYLEMKSKVNLHKWKESVNRKINLRKEIYSGSEFNPTMITILLTGRGRSPFLASRRDNRLNRHTPRLCRNCDRVVAATPSYCSWVHFKTGQNFERKKKLTRLLPDQPSPKWILGKAKVAIKILTNHPMMCGLAYKNMVASTICPTHIRVKRVLYVFVLTDSPQRMCGQHQL